MSELHEKKDSVAWDSLADASRNPWDDDPNIAERYKSGPQVVTFWKAHRLHLAEQKGVTLCGRAGNWQLANQSREEAHAKRLLCTYCMRASAREAGSAIGAALLGAIIAGVLAFLGVYVLHWLGVI